MPYDAEKEARRLGNEVCPTDHEKRWTICPDCAERFLRAAYEQGRADLTRVEKERDEATARVEAVLQGQRDLAAQTVRIRRAALGDTEREGVDTEVVVLDLWAASVEAHTARDAAEAESEGLRAALRSVFPVGSWCPHCGQGIDTPETRHCKHCSPSRAALARAGDH